MRKKLFVPAVTLLFLMLPGLLKGADERILSFHSDIVVHEDSTLTVCETIRVRSARKQIKRGIYRDFPTVYKDRLGNKYVVRFNVKEVLRDGKQEKYHLKDLRNGKRVYIGQKNVILPRGEYTYTLTYETNRQIGFFKEYDELYWNVTGSGWAFPIDSASASVKLPGDAEEKFISLDGYTGPQGAKGKSFRSSISTEGNIVFSTTRPLNPKEGLTIAVSWPKGFVSEPSAQQKFNDFIQYNRGVFIGFLGLFILLVYYIIAWARVGKDPARGTIIPLYNPPEKLSPASVRYILKMGYDNKCFTAAVINMAVKGFLNIHEKKGVYTLAKNEIDQKSLSAEEKKIASELLGSRDKIKLKNTNHAKIRKTVESIKKVLSLNFEKVYFFTNRQYFFPGLIMSVLILLLSLLLTSSKEVVIFFSIWLSIWSVGVAALLSQAFHQWRSVFSRSRKTSSLGGAIFLTLFALPFVGVEILVLATLGKHISHGFIGILVVIMFVNVLFYHLLEAPTLIGRKVLDKIEGFRMFLSVAEKDRLNLLNPPDRTPELFEKYLPYALALDVEQAWSEQFSDVLAKAAEAGQEYTPTWYTGTSFGRMDSGRFASALGSSLSKSVSSSSVAPGSSSGSFGGGSSGGGGGGGGGGGW